MRQGALMRMRMLDGALIHATMLSMHAPSSTHTIRIKMPPCLHAINIISLVTPLQHRHLEDMECVLHDITSPTCQ
jgi:hypothetical protein